MLSINLLGPDHCRDVRFVSAWINMCVKDADALQALDHHLLPEPGSESADEMAQALRAAWGEWAEQTEAVLARVDPNLVDPTVRQRLEVNVFTGRVLSEQSLQDLRYHLSCP